MPKLVVFSGAGISKESGLSTFRDSDGLWESHNINTVCNSLTWKNHFHTVHKFYNALRSQVALVQPNTAHRMVAKWQSQHDVTILTQNVDDLFERAGCTGVIHLHGRISDMRCEACGYNWSIGSRAWNAGVDVCDNPTRICGSKKGVRPGIVMFNDPAPEYRRLYGILQELTPEDVLLITGTSGDVIDINSLIFDNPAVKLYNNVVESDRSFYKETFVGPAGEQFARIDEWLNNYWT